MKKIGAISVLLALLGCAQIPAAPLPLSEQMPQVLYAVPEGTTALSTTARMALIFSKPIDPYSLGSDSVLLTQGQVDMASFQDTTDLFKTIDKGGFSEVPLNLSLKEGNKVLIITPDEALQPENTYTLMVTSRLFSQDRLPFSQTPQGSMTPYVIVYNTKAAGTIPPGVSQSDQDPIFDEGPGGAGGSGGTPPLTSPTPSQGNSGGTSGSGALPSRASGGSAGSARGGGGGTSPAAVAGRVVLNEIYYDAVGSDTDGVLFVELYGTPGMLLEGFKINFINGGTGSVDDSITLPKGAKMGADSFFVIADARTSSPKATNVVGADLIDNFDPQNGPDAVQLLDPSGKLVDAVGYGIGVVARAANGLAAFEGTPTLDVINGHSIERKSPGFDSNDNQKDFLDRVIPTPRR